MGRLLAAVVTVAAVVLGAGGAGAQDGGAALTGQIDAGFDGLFVPGRPVPVRVVLSATELASGQLRVHLGAGISETVDFEVTGGSSEQHWVLLDSPPGDGIVAQAMAETERGAVELDRTALRWDPEVHILGTLDGLGSGLELDDVGTRILDQDIHFVSLEPAMLDLGPNAVAAIDSIAVTADDLSSLPAAHREALLGWLAMGGTLYVDGDAGPIPDWPEAYQPRSGSVRGGLARVVATGGALAEGRWSDVVVPATNRSIHEDRGASANVPGPDVGSELFNVDLGRDLPSLTGLLGILGVYIVLVGPVAYLASRRRVMARWVAIPVLAGLATGVLFISGDGLSSDTSVSVVNVIETGPGTAMASSRVLIATDSGSRDVVAPSGWMAENDDQMGGFGQIEQRRTNDEVRLSVSAPPGGVGYLNARGPVDLDGALEVRATAAAHGTVTGTVHNTTDLPLVHVAVFAGRTSSALVGSLPPGGSADFELVATNQFRFAAQPLRQVWAGLGAAAEPGPFPGATTTVEVGGGGFGPIVMEECDDSGNCTQCDANGNCLDIGGPGLAGPIVMEECDQFGNCTQCDDRGNCVSSGGPPPPMQCDEFGNCFPVGGGCMGPGPCGPASPVRPEALAAALWDRGTNVMAPGLITAVGWTTELEPVLDLGSGVDVVESHTALVGRAAPEAAGDHLMDASAVRSLVSVVDNGDDGLMELVFRFDLPSTVGQRPLDPSRLRMDLPAMFSRVSVLTDDGELPLRALEPHAAIQDRQEVTVPPAAFVDGHVYVRVALPFAPPPPGRELVIYEVAGS